MQPFDILPTYPPRPTYSIAPVPTPLGFQGGGWFTGAVGATSYPASFNPAPFNGQGSSSEEDALPPAVVMAQLNDMLATLTPALYAATPAQAPLPPQLAVADVNLGFHVTNCVLSDATKIPTRLVWRPPLLPTAEGIVHAQSDTDASQPMVICQWAGCTGSFPRTSEGLSAHFAEAHPGERIERVDGLHNCRWGACTQFNLKYIRKHLIAHTGCAARACLECGKNYMRVDLRNRHMRVTHGLVVKRSGDVVDLKGSHVGTISPMRLQQTKDRYTPY